MSSVSGSGGSNRQDEVIRRAREEHQTKESELVKRHNKEIRRLNESHQAELDRINANHSQQMDELRKASQKQMSVQTMRHQRDAEDMRRLYQQQAQKSAYENERKMDALRESIGKDKETTVQNQNDRLEAVNEHYREVLTGKDQAHEKSLREMRDSQQEAIARNRESLEAAHKKELDALETDRRERFGDLQKRYNNLQASTTQRLKQQEVQHLSDKQRMSDNLIETVSRERRAFDDTLQVQREGFQDSLRKQADSHEQRYAKEREAIANTRENLKADLGSRIGNQIRGLERQVADLKAVNVRKELEVKRKAKQEVENIRTSYQKNIDSYEDQKKAAVDFYNERNAEDIKDIRKELSGQMVEQGRFYRRQISVENARNREAMDQLNTDFEARQNQTKQQADERVAVVREDSANQVERMREHYEDKSATERITKAEENLDLRQKLAQEKTEAIERMRAQVREEEIRHEREMNQLKAAYDKRIAKMNDARVKENEGQKIREKRLVKDMSRLHETQLAGQKVQYEERMAEMNDRHQKELQTIQQRHNDRIDQMAVVTKKT